MSGRTVPVDTQRIFQEKAEGDSGGRTEAPDELMKVRFLACMYIFVLILGLAGCGKAPASARTGSAGDAPASAPAESADMAGSADEAPASAPAESADMTESAADALESASIESADMAEGREEPAGIEMAENVEEPQPSSLKDWEMPIEGLPEDFIFGMDASSVLVEEKSGVKFYNFDGEEQDVFKTLGEAGINYIRLRVWNDPYDSEGHGYGGGNNDLATAIVLGKRATDCGMRVYIDFHYSDFWADPSRQHAPKAWEGMDLEQTEEALYIFTREALTQLLDAGVDVGMVQIGNEINYGMSGVTKREEVNSLLKSGSRAVREVSSAYDKDIQIAVHYTNISDKAQVLGLVEDLVKCDVDFDMIGLSYYPFWNGSFKNMKRVLELIPERFGKKAFLAETSYPYTLEDGDGNDNSVGNSADLMEGYLATVNGQAQMIHDICKNVNEAGGAGFFYWEGTWIPVGKSGDDNSPIWEEYGSGWASSYACDYDPEQAGKYYGGCSWDNQALFDFHGYPLKSLRVFRCANGDGSD